MCEEGTVTIMKDEVNGRPDKTLREALRGEQDIG